MSKNKALQKEWRASSRGKSLVLKAVNRFSSTPSGLASIKATRRASKLKKYNMTEDQWSEMLTKQNGACAICKTLPNERGLCIDHDHSIVPIRVRGLLCDPCNRGLSCFRDNLEYLQRASDYIRETSHERD